MLVLSVTEKKWRPVKLPFVAPVFKKQIWGPGQELTSRLFFILERRNYSYSLPITSTTLNLKGQIFSPTLE